MNKIENKPEISTFTVNPVPELRGTYSPGGRQLEVRSIGDLVRAGIHVPRDLVARQFGPADAAEYAEARKHDFYRNNR